MATSKNKAFERSPLASCAGSADGWTVRAEDYDKLATAARMLASACKHQLPPGFFAQVEEEYRAVRELLSPPNETKISYAGEDVA